MRPRVKILIVEDEAVLYERLRRALNRENFEVFEYTPSYEDAIKRLNIEQPDVVLLDVALKGEKTGLDLGKVLNAEYHIPFIYVTEYEDNSTFYQGLNTNHADFIVKTKPELNLEEVVRSIHTVLHNQKRNFEITQNGVLGLNGYLENLKGMGNEETTKVPVSFEDILFFSNRDCPKLNGSESLKRNYIWLQTSDISKNYFLKSSLRDLCDLLPAFFVRINESYIVNLKTQSFRGITNSKRLLIGGRSLEVSDTYRQNVEAKIVKLYGKPN